MGNRASSKQPVVVDDSLFNVGNERTDFSVSLRNFQNSPPNQTEFEIMMRQIAEMDINGVNHGSLTVPRPCLRFHTIKGQNVTLTQNNSVASRNPGVFCKGLVFSDRPVELDEIVCIKLAKVAETWSGMFRVGLTSVDPACFRDIELPKYACPNLTYRPGYWAKSVPDRFCVQNSVIHFFINDTGSLFFATDGVFQGIFISDIDVSEPLWLMMDIYGNTESIEILENYSPQSAANLVDPVEIQQPEYRPVRPIISNDIPPYIFHFLVGANACRLGSWKVKRQQGRNQGYCFLQRPLRVDEHLAIRVIEADDDLIGCIAFGLTSCNPNNLTEEDLPVDFNDFVERPEYWVGIKDVVAYPEENDVLQFTITTQGIVTCSKNGIYPRTIMHVDTSVPLWPFFDLNGSTVGIQLIPPLPERVRESTPPRILTPNNDFPSSSHRFTRNIRHVSPDSPELPNNRHRRGLSDESDEINVPPSFVRRLRELNIDNDSDAVHSILTPINRTPQSDVLENENPRDLPSFNRTHTNNDNELRNSLNLRYQIFDSDDDEIETSLRRENPARNVRPSAVSAGIVRTTMEFARLHREASPDEDNVRVSTFRNLLSRRRRSLSQPTTHVLDSSTDTSHDFSSQVPLSARNDTLSSGVTSLERHSATAPSSTSRLEEQQLTPEPVVSPAVNESGNEGDNGGEDSNTDCVVCWSSRANAAVYRCGHVCMCLSCARRLSTTSGTCPMCRQTILDVVQLFYA